jgi:hypothetical protein
VNKGLLLLLAAVAVAAGAFFLVRGGGSEPGTDVRLIETPKIDERSVDCVECGSGFRVGEAKPAPGRQGFLLCPRCGKPTPMTAPRAPQRGR